MQREHVSVLRWLAFAGLLVVASLVVATLMVAAADTLGIVAMAVVGLGLAGPMARFITLPIRVREPRRRGAWGTARLRAWLLFDGLVLGGGAALVGAALLGRAVAGNWGIVVGVATAGVLVWAITAQVWKRWPPKVEE